MINKNGALLDPYMGCITDRLQSGLLTIPIFAQFCSRHCYYLLPYNTFYYYEHEVNEKQNGQSQILKSPSKPKGKADEAPRLAKVHVCPYIGKERNSFDANSQTFF